MGGKHVNEQQGDIAQRDERQCNQCGVNQDGVTITETVKPALIVVLVIAHDNSIV